MLRCCTLVDATLIAATCVPIRCYIAVRWWMLRCCNLRVSACYVAVTCVPLDATMLYVGGSYIVVSWQLHPLNIATVLLCTISTNTLFGKCLKSISSFSKAGNEELPQAKLSVQGSTLGRLKERKKGWLTGRGRFSDAQNHWKLPMKNNIISKYLRKRSIL